MEPTTTTSPGARPATTTPYFPSFLLGEQQTTTSPRNNALSPHKTGVRKVSFGFGTSPGTVLPPEQKNAVNYPGTPVHTHNTGVSGPPTLGLFDSLRHERNQVLTPTRAFQTQSHLAANNMSQFNSSVASAYGVNPNLSGQQSDSYFNAYSLNVSRAGRMSPLMLETPNPNMQGANTSKMLQSSPQPYYTEYWITVFGFPSSATSIILQHFAQFGKIVNKVFPGQNGNWVHLKYSSILECEKALKYNGKILASNIMVGVTQCKAKSIIDKESICATQRLHGTPKIRSLVKSLSDSEINTTGIDDSNGPQMSGLMNKAIDFLFG